MYDFTSISHSTPVVAYRLPLVYACICLSLLYVPGTLLTSQSGKVRNYAVNLETICWCLFWCCLYLFILQPFLFHSISFFPVALTSRSHWFTYAYECAIRVYVIYVHYIRIHCMFVHTFEQIHAYSRIRGGVKRPCFI